MITLKKMQAKLKQDNRAEPSPQKQISISDKLLIKEVQELDSDENGNMPESCKVSVSEPSRLHQFFLVITPNAGYWQRGTFKFKVRVPEEFNIVPPKGKMSDQAVPL